MEALTKQPDRAVPIPVYVAPRYRLRAVYSPCITWAWPWHRGSEDLLLLVCYTVIHVPSPGSFYQCRFMVDFMLESFAMREVRNHRAPALSLARALGKVTRLILDDSCRMAICWQPWRRRSTWWASSRGVESHWAARASDLSTRVCNEWTVCRWVPPRRPQ